MPTKMPFIGLLEDPGVCLGVCHLGSLNPGVAAGEHESDTGATWHFKNPSVSLVVTFFSYLAELSLNKARGFRYFYGLLYSFSIHFYKP